VSALAMIAASVVIVTAALAWSPDVASAADGYSLTSSAVYRFDPATPAVDVVTTYEMRNTTPDRDVGGGRIEFFYYEGLRVPIDDAVSDLRVQVNGEDATYVASEVDGFQVLDVEFRSRLRYDHTFTVVVSYRLLGEPPRTDDSFIRVNPAYVSFPVYAYADDGTADVRIELPDDWTPDYVGSDFDRRSRESGVLVLESTDIAVTSDFGVLFTARQDERLVSTPLTVGDSLFEVRAWPGDADWLAFTQRQISEGVPTLERLVGAPWPEANETDVIQASTPYLRGYAGFYFADTDVIEVGEDLDSHTMLHELSHAWFNDATIAERWISEGLADEIGARAVAALGDELPAPEDYDADDPELPIDQPAPFPLNEWGRPANALDDDTEYYGYRTSFLVMRSLYDELGEAKMSDLVAAVLAGERAYQGEDGADGSDVTTLDDGPVGWREFLDLAEQVGGATGMEDLYRQYIVSDGQVDELDRRGELTVRYVELAERGGTWSPPEAVRAAMADWSFFGAGDQIDRAVAALDIRDRIDETLTPIGLDPAAPIEVAYQESTDLEATAGELDDQMRAARRLVAARLDLLEHLDSLGLESPALTQADYDAAPVGLASDAEQLEDQGADLVTGAASLDATLAPYDLSVPPLAADAFAVSPGEALATVAANQRAASAVAGAYRERDDAASLLERIGALGSDVDTHLDDAADRLAAGDTEAATAAADEASATLAEWDTRGTARLVAVGIGLVLGLALVVLTSVRRRRRRAAPPAAEGTAPIVPTEATDRDDVPVLDARTTLDAPVGAPVDHPPPTTAEPEPAAEPG
jgi:hypothetical protein